MWLEIFAVLNFIVLQNSIFCQPVTDSIRDTRQTFEECCPCSRDDGTDYREPDMSPNSPIGSFNQEEDGCPCRFDSQGSPSIFRPFILRNSHPSERDQQFKQRPLLEPEVGLASSVLETIQKATDEEYQEALEREASRSLIEIEPGFLDSEPGNTRNSVTIVLNPREDLYDTDDTMPKASHVHETRCIHSPLGRASMPSNDMAPRMSKQKLFLKRKPIGTSRALFDMDNGASNIKETFAVNDKDLGTKLRMNPLSLKNLATGDDIDRIPKVNSRYELKTINPGHSNDLKNELNTPKHRLAALRSRLRDLVEMRNIKRLNNPTPLKQNNLDIFSIKDNTDKIVRFDNSPLDPLFDNASPVLKNIMKLKDVEILPPKELFGKGFTNGKSKLSDLNAAGSENNVKISDIDGAMNANSIESNIRVISDFEHSVLKDKEDQSGEESATGVQIKYSNKIQALSEKENDIEKSKDSLIEEMRRRLDDCLRSANKAQEVVNKIDQTDNVDSYEYDSKEADDEDEIEDPVAETSDMKEKISQEVDNPSADKVNSSQIAEEESKLGDSLSEQANNGLATFKNDILRKLDNIKKSIKSKLQDTDAITRPVISQPEKENLSTNQDISNSDLNSEGDQNMAVTLKPEPAEDDDITVQDLQKLSDSLLQQEYKLSDNAVPSSDDETFKDSNENKNHEPIDMINDDRSESSELDPMGIDAEEPEASSEDDDPIIIETTLNDNQENNSPESSKDASDIIENGNVPNSDSMRPKDSETEEMSSQASNSKYNAIIPLNDNLNGPTLQDTISLFKTPLQIPSLEEIRQGITDIIDAGQRESDHFQSELDPLNESSNRNSVLSNPLQSSLSKTNYLGNSLTDRYLRPFQNARNNLLDTTPLKPLTEPFTNPSILRDYPLTLVSNRPYPTDNKILKASSNPTRIPSLDDITRFFDNSNHLKSPKINLPKTNLPKSTTFNQHKNSLADDLKYRFDTQRPEFKQANYGKLGKPKLEKDDFLQSISRKHEDMKEKLQALHLDFNDRLASMYKRLNDQKLQSVNNPTFKAKDNRVELPKSAAKNERIGQNLKSNSFPSRPQLLQDHTSIKKEPTPKTNSAPLKIPLRNNNFNKANDKYPNLSEKQKLNINKQKITPISKVKISFTTPNPLLTSSSKQQKSADPIKMPSRLSEKEKSGHLNTNLNDITKALRSRFQLSDSNHAPSEVIDTKQLNEATNSQYVPTSVNNQPRVNSKANSDIVPNLEETEQSGDGNLPKKKESPLMSNLREALKARLQNITDTHLKAAKKPVETTNLREADAIVSPSNVKTSVLQNPLIENTSYKCTMICSKDK